MTVIDCTRSPAAAAMRAVGVTGVIRYVSLLQADTVWKRITKAEYEQLRIDGFDVLLNFEYDAGDWLDGAAAGSTHAAAAVGQAKAMGYPAGCAIPGSADFNMSRAQWDNAGAAYARAYRDGIRAGGYVPGVYGPWDVLGWCRDLGGFGMFWQAGMSTAWSGGRNAQPWPGAHLRQRGHLTVGGVDCDYNDVLQAAYGQAGGDMALKDDPDAWAAATRLEAAVHMHDKTQANAANGDGEPVELVAAIKEIRDAVTAPPAPVPVDVDLDALAEKVIDKLLARLKG